MFLVFDTYEKADFANNQISQNMRLTGDVTVTWSDIIETSDTKFAIAKSDDRFMADIVDYQSIDNILTVESQDK